MVPHRRNTNRSVFQVICCLLILLCASASPLAQPVIDNNSEAEQKNILLLYSYGHGGKGLGIFDEGLLSALSEAGIGTNRLYFEFLDLERNKEVKEHRQNLRTELLTRYANKHIALIITVQQPALGFLLQEGSGIAPHAPAITVQAPIPQPDQTLTRPIVSQLAKFDIQGTLERALELFPDTQRVMFVSGASEADRKMAEESASIAAAWKGKLAFEYSSDLSLDQLARRVAALPPHTIIIFTQFNRDAGGLVTVAYEVEGMLVKTANAPVFGLYDFNLVNGGIGGSVVSVKALGEHTARTAIDLLSGKLTLTQPVTPLNNPVSTVFNWRQIERWGGDPNRLSVKSTFINRQPTFWEQYKVYVLLATLILLIQSASIAALIVSRRRMKLTKNLLRESEEQFRSVVEGTSDAIYLKDVDGRYLLVNSAMVRIVGKSSVEIIGHDDYSLFPHEEAQVVMKEDRRVMSGGTIETYEEVLTTAEGMRATFLSTKGPVRNKEGKVTGLFGIARDITDRKKLEEALATNEKEFRLLAESMPQIVWITRPDGWNVYFNQQWVTYTGLSLEESYGDGWNKPFHPDDQQRAADAWQNAVNHNGNYSLECRLRRKDGVYRWWLIRGVPVLDANGKIAKWFGTCTDIDEIREAENARARLEAQLRESQKMEAIGTLAGGIAHDFNNLITMILGNVALARQDVAENPELRLSVDEIDKAAKRARNLVQQILTFSRKQKQELVSQPIRPAVEEALRLMRASLPSGVNLIIKLADTPLQVRCDANQIEQVVMNLCANAWQSISGHEGHIEVRLEQAQLGGETTQLSGVPVPGNYALLSVSDNGTGMDVETQEHIFEPFYTTKDVGKGTGLGMSVVHGIIVAHQGAIKIHSAPGQGTKIEVYLPICTVAKGAVPPEPAPKILHGSGQRVLYVDDEGSLVLLVKRMLNRQGYRTTVCSSAQEAINAVRVDPNGFDIVVSDLNMPGKSGLELANELRGIRPDLPVVIVSGYLTEELRTQALHAGARQVVYKQNTVDELCQTIQGLLSTKANLD